MRIPFTYNFFQLSSISFHYKKGTSQPIILHHSIPHFISFALGIFILLRFVLLPCTPCCVSLSASIPIPCLIQFKFKVSNLRFMSKIHFNYIINYINYWSLLICLWVLYIYFFNIYAWSAHIVLVVVAN